MKCELYPYITPLASGGIVEVTNSDPSLHDLHMVDEFGSTHSPQPAGAKSTLVFPHAERARLGCDLHYFTSGWVYVTDAIFATVTDESGAFAFRDVPVGTWRLSAWHERLGEKGVDVFVVGGIASSTSLALPMPSPPPPGPAGSPSPKPL